MIGGTVEGGVAGGRDIALSLLRTIERTALYLDHSRLQKSPPAADHWWVQHGDEVEGPQSLRVVLDRLLHGHSPVQIVHESEAALEPVPWRSLSYRPNWLDRKRILVWRIGFWFMLAMVLFAIVNLAIPFGYRPLGTALYWLAVAGIATVRLRRRAAKRASASDGGTDQELTLCEETVTEAPLIPPPAPANLRANY